MKIIAMAHTLPGTTLEKMMPLLKDEVTVAWELQKEGYIRELYLRADVPLAVVILECADVAQAQEVMGRHVMVKAGLIDFDYYPLQAFTPFEVLFTGSWTAPS